MLASVLFLTVLARAAPAAEDGLTVFVSRATSALLDHDWGEFRQYADSYFTIEFHRRLYRQELQEGADYYWDDSADSLTVASTVVIGNSEELDSVDKDRFIEFCDMVEDARGYWSDAWGDWPTIKRGAGDFGFESLVLASQNFSSKIASNLEFVVTFGKYDDGWKCTRLILEGH